MACMPHLWVIIKNKIYNYIEILPDGNEFQEEKDTFNCKCALCLDV